MPVTPVTPTLSRGPVQPENLVLFFSFSIEIYPHKGWHQEGSTNHAENWTIERCDRGSLACLWGRKQKKDLPSDSAWRPIRIKEPDLDDEDIWNILQSGNDSKFLRPLLFHNFGVLWQNWDSYYKLKAGNDYHESEIVIGAQLLSNTITLVAFKS